MYSGHPVERWESAVYELVLVDRESRLHMCVVYGTHKITKRLEAVLTDRLAALFGGLKPKDVNRPTGEVHVMIGLDYAELHPAAQYRVGRLRLLRSQFGSGWLMDGRHSLIGSGTGPVVASLVGWCSRGEDSPFKVERLQASVQCPACVNHVKYALKDQQDGRDECENPQMIDYPTETESAYACTICWKSEVDNLVTLARALKEIVAVQDRKYTVAMDQVAKVRRLEKMIIPMKLQHALGLDSATAQSTTGRVE